MKDTLKIPARPDPSMNSGGAHQPARPEPVEGFRVDVEGFQRGIKILHIITSLRLGGAEVALLNRLKVMRHDAAHQVICFYDGPIANSIRDLGIPVVLIRGLIKGYDPIGIWQVLRIVRQFKPNIIHTSLWAANMVGRLVGRCLRIPVINELHGNVAHEGWLRNALERLSLCWADRIVAVSPSVRATYEQQIIKSLRLVTIPNGIDRDDLVARVVREPLQRAVLGLAEDDFVVGAIGRFEKIKSYDVLIRSFARFCKLVLDGERSTVCHPGLRSGIHSVRLLLIGGGSQRVQLEQLVTDLNLAEQVIFTGYRLDAYKFYPLFDCFALSSQSEGLSIALLEALALGIPVITTNLSTEHDAVINGKNGLLIPVNDVEAYALGLLALYNGRLVKSNAMEPLADYPFSIDRVAKAYREMYGKFTNKI